MQFTKLGRSDLIVSQICLGTMTFGWSTDEQSSHAILDRAFHAGINFIDTANIYSRWMNGNHGGELENIIGQWMKGKPRDQLIIATKTIVFID